MGNGARVYIPTIFIPHEKRCGMKGGGAGLVGRTSALLASSRASPHEKMRKRSFEVPPS